MYATLSDLLNDLFGNFLLSIIGHKIPPLPIQTFGFFMALSFIGAYIVITAELKRKEALGLLTTIQQKVTINKPISQTDLILNILVGALIGYKLLEMVFDYSSLIQNPQEFILSTKGNVLGLFIGGGIAFYYKKKEADAVKGKGECRHKSSQYTDHIQMKTTGTDFD